MSSFLYFGLPPIHWIRYRCAFTSFFLINKEVFQHRDRFFRFYFLIYSNFIGVFFIFFFLLLMSHWSFTSLFFCCYLFMLNTVASDKLWPINGFFDKLLAILFNFHWLFLLLNFLFLLCFILFVFAFLFCFFLLFWCGSTFIFCLFLLIKLLYQFKRLQKQISRLLDELVREEGMVRDILFLQSHTFKVIFTHAEHILEK